MIYTFLCILVIVATGLFVSYKEAKTGILDNSILRSLFGGAALLVGLIASVVFAFIALQYTGAQHKADIINREYGTSYTQAEVFYASDVINIVRELDRKRYEINGDFRRQRDPQRNLRPEERR